MGSILYKNYTCNALSKDTETALGIVGTAIGTAIATSLINWLNKKFEER